MKMSWLIHIGIILFLLIVIPIFLGLFLGGAAVIGSIILCVFMFGIPLVFTYLGLRSIKTLVFLNLIISIPLIIVAGIFAYEKGPTQFLAVPLFLYSFALAIINFVAIFIYWNKYNFKALFPIIISIATFILCICSVIIGNRVNLYVFNKRINQFEDAVKMVADRTRDVNPIRLGDNEIPEQYRRLSYFIYGENKNGILRVDFYWGRGFPVKHTAYVYLSDDKIPGKGSDFRKDWHSCYRIRENWFRVSD